MVGVVGSVRNVTRYSPRELVEAKLFFAHRHVAALADNQVVHYLDIEQFSSDIGEQDFPALFAFELVHAT